MLDDINSFFDTKAIEQVESQNSLYPLSPTMPNVLDYFYKNLEMLGYNLTELKPALEQDGTSLIISCAGSGKTTFLVFKLIRDYLNGEFYMQKDLQTANGVVQQQIISKVLISTFLKTGAEELKNAFDEQCTRLRVTGICADNFVFSTLHAEYYSILKDIGVTPDILTDEENTDALKRACMSLGIRNRTRSTYGVITKDELADVSCIVTYARNHIDEKRYKHPLCDEYAIKPALLDKLIELFGKYRAAVNKQDFEELQELVYTGIMTNPNFANMIANRYRYVFLDEFQDVSQIQYAILKTYIQWADKTIAIGDDDQCIYSWRGSDIDIITKQFKDDFNPTIHKFTVNYRCKSNILAPVISSITRNTNRYEKDLRAYKQGGTVVRQDISNVNDVLANIKVAISNRQSIGILSRTNFDLLAPAILCELDGTFDFTISKAIGINSAIPRLVLGCIKLLTRRYTEDFEDLLKPFATNDKMYHNTGEAKMIANLLCNDSQKKFFDLNPEDLAYSCPNLYRQLYKPVKEATDKKAAYIYMLRFLISKHFKGNSPYALKARQFIMFIDDLIHNHTLCQRADITQLDDLFTDILPLALSKKAYSKKTANVRLTTVHEAKGKEWDTVILWNDSNGVFPAQVGNHIITQAEFEEERRLHYIAFTRAKEKLIIYYSETNPSPFLLECDFSVQDTEIEENTQVSVKLSDTVQTPLDSIRETISYMLTDNKTAGNTYAALSYFNYDMEQLTDRVYATYTTMKADEDSGLIARGDDLLLETEYIIGILLDSFASNITSA